MDLNSAFGISECNIFSYCSLKIASFVIASCILTYIPANSNKHLEVLYIL